MFSFIFIEFIVKNFKHQSVAIIVELNNIIADSCWDYADFKMDLMICYYDV